MHALLVELHRPWTSTALAITALGTLDLVYALAPKWSTRRLVLRYLFWGLYPVLVLFFFTGRRARTDRETHLLYAGSITALGLVLLAASLWWRL